MKRYCLLLFVFLHMYSVSSVLGWNDDVTHKDLSEIAARNSSLSSTKEDLLASIGFEDGIQETLIWPNHVCDENTKQSDCRVIDWLKYGAEKEDSAVRPLNHFHNPITDEGLSNLVPSIQLSALVWGQDYNAQLEKGGFEGDQSWSTLRNLFYIALTLDDGENGSDESVREETFAQLFKGLGHQMHLVQDMAVPYHVRNDAHPLDAMQGNPWLRFVMPRSTLYFETWAKKHRVDINKFALAAGANDFPNLPFDQPFPGVDSPISQLWDSNEYNGTNPSNSNEQGLAEYTSSNFFSEGTRFAAEDESLNFPYPKRSSMELLIDSDGRFKKIYLAKQGDGENVTHFVRAPYLYFLTYSDPT